MRFKGVRAQQNRLLLVHNKLTTFVRIDRDLLRERYQVEELAVSGASAGPWRVWPAVRRCDVVFCWFASAHSLLPALAGRALGRPVVMVVGGYDTANLPRIGYGHQRGGLKKRVARLAMAAATDLIANSRFTRDEAVREAGVDGRRITVVYHGVPSPNAGARSASTEAPRDIVLTAGNVDRPNLWRKGLEPFVRAAALLPDRDFILAGAWLDGAIDHLRSIAPPNVTFTGRLSDAELDGLFRRASVYVQASAHEGFGLALAQAMAAGCVSVVTRAGALPEVVGEAGIYADSSDPGDLAAAIARALAAAPELRAAAVARVAASFPLESRAGGLAGVIDAALSRRSARAGPAPTPTAEARDEIPEADLPLVSVVIPVRDEERLVGACLEAVLAQEYPPGRLEVLVVDGGSTDHTREIVARIAAGDAGRRVRPVENPRGLAASGLNAGIRAARGRVIARVDGHTVVAPDYVRRCVEALQRTGADNVGGLMRPVGRGYIGRCIALATGSRFGIGNSRFHYDERGGPAETVYLGCFRREIFERVGLFDEGLPRNQDDELNDRITAAGGLIWLDPGIRSTYYARESLPALWRQYYGYGFWKVRVLRRHPRARRARHLAPAALVLGLGGTPALRVLLGRAAPAIRAATALLAAAAWGVYAAAALVASGVVASRAGWRYLPGLLVAFWCLHLGYGSGFLAGLAAEARRPERL